MPSDRYSHTLMGELERLGGAEYDLIKYRLTNDALGIAHWDMDVVYGDPINPNNKFSWSEEFRHMLGFSGADEFPDRLSSWSDRLHPGDKGRVLDAFTAHLTDPTGQTPYNLEYRLMTKDGEYRHFRAVGLTLRDGRGTSLKVAGALEDITERVSQQKMLENILNTMDTNVFITDLDTDEILFISKRMASDFKLDADVKGELCWRLLQVGQNGRCPWCKKHELQKNPEGCVVWETDNPVSGRSLHNIERVIDWPGGRQVHMQQSIDITDQKKMMAAIEERDRLLRVALGDAERANSAKSSFLAQMSHEIRTPLNVVIGLSELTLGECKLSGETESNLEKIYSAGATILSIVNDILDISKIESGKLQMYPVQYETPSFINDVATLNMVRIGEKPIAFQLAVDENLPVLLYGDDVRVKQVFNNLLSNAFKYTDAGTVEWRLGFERDEDDIWLLSSVRDTGRGMRPEDLQNLFSDYNQVDVSANRDVGGTGLGLAITKRLAEMMDGSVTVESEYGKGSVFHVRLRQILASDAPIGAEAARNLMGMRYTLAKRGAYHKLKRADLSGSYALVVDDIPTNLDVVRGMLRPYGLNIDCASGGAQAVERIRAGEPRYSVVFMDHMMPEMDGIEAVRIIREEIGTDYARNVPIVALTANAIVGNEEMFLQNGFQDFISKPIDTVKLDAALRAWVRDKSFAELYLPREETPCLPPGFAVAGVDVAEAQERFGNDAAALRDVWRSYAVNTRPLLLRLWELLEAERLADYAVVVHGIKGSSYGVCAQEIGKAAEMLETAARDGDLGAVTVGHAAFAPAVETLLQNLDRALAELDAAASSELPLLPEPDPALLQELREGAAAFDMDRVDSAIERLEANRYERGGELVRWLREQTDGGDFESLAGGEWPERQEG